MNIEGPEADMNKVINEYHIYLFLEGFSISMPNLSQAYFVCWHIQHSVYVSGTKQSNIVKNSWIKNVEMYLQKIITLS